MVVLFLDDRHAARRIQRWAGHVAPLDDAQLGSREHRAALPSVLPFRHAHALLGHHEAVAEQPLLLAVPGRAAVLAEPRLRLLLRLLAVLADGLAAAVGVGSLRLRFSLLAMLRATQLLPLAAIPLAPLLLVDRLLDASALLHDGFARRLLLLARVVGQPGRQRWHDQLGGGGSWRGGGGDGGHMHGLVGGSTCEADWTGLPCASSGQVYVRPKFNVRSEYLTETSFFHCTIINGHTKQGVGEGQGPHLREQDNCKDDQGHRGTGAGSASRHGGGLGRVYPQGCKEKCYAF